MKRKFTFFTDPSHGWLKVKITDLPRIGLRTDDFTPFSYQYGDNLYLEEDCDATTFIDKWSKTFGSCDYSIRNTNRQSRIRSYPHLHSKK